MTAVIGKRILGFILMALINFLIRRLQVKC